MTVLVSTKQFKMILETEFVERLKAVAKRAGRDSAQHLAEEVLTVYLPVYTAVMDATNRAIAYQSSVDSRQGNNALIPNKSAKTRRLLPESEREDIQREGKQNRKTRV